MQAIQLSPKYSYWTLFRPQRIEDTTPNGDPIDDNTIFRQQIVRDRPLANKNPDSNEISDSKPPPDVPPVIRMRQTTTRAPVLPSLTTTLRLRYFII
jgi:hypothetical protein